ncbi:unnamed protein product [Cuscuta europaea]|uniref:Uncharacterized protein n=1 Tax=Cuscuta europaea TaxID=41803 RepID=A0A9P0YH10_CUSEU|nr:unnamed protein product [Cuscuta europaea]
MHRHLSSASMAPTLSHINRSLLISSASFSGRSPRPLPCPPVPSSTTLVEICPEEVAPTRKMSTPPGENLTVTDDTVTLFSPEGEDNTGSLVGGSGSDLAGKWRRRSWWR